MIALRRLASDRRGVALTEFAMVAPVLALMLMGLFDLCHRHYVNAILAGTLQQAGRKSTLETGAASTSTIDAAIEAAVDKVAPNATYASVRRNYHSFSDVNRPEDYTDANSNNRYDVGECFEDSNGNGVWDADMARSGQGGADDVVAYTVTVTYPRLFPMWSLFGEPNQSISATTILRNQPYATQGTRSVVECS